MKIQIFVNLARSYSMAPKNTTDILKKLRDVMQNTNYSNRRLDAYIVPHGDSHQNEYVGSCDQRLAFVSGFTGSLGTAIVAEKHAALWTDGRYFLQAENEIDDNWTLMKEGVTGTPTFRQFLKNVLPVNGQVGVDALLMSFQTFKSLSSELELQGHALLPIDINLVDAVWTEKPFRLLNTIESIPLRYTGKSMQEKVLDLRKRMVKYDAAAVVITALDQIAWLFNLRGSDIEFNPVFYSYSIVTADSVILFIDEAERLTAEAKACLESDASMNLRIFPYETVTDVIQTLVDENCDKKIWIQGESSYSLVKLIPEKQLLLKETPISLSKAIKNEQEIECARNAHIKDAAALCEFFHWMTKHVRDGICNEISAANKLEEFRKMQDHYVGPSFETISAYGPNGAIIHYRPTRETNKVISGEKLYLCDSGAQYRDGGTTDITRTMHFGYPNSFERMCYTLVLKGHIALSSAIFPQNISGNRLDSFARQPLWEVGLDYMHGTGHGVGSYLNVHEGPIGIHYHQNKLLAGLQAGMILSIEPGVYLDGKFGIRLENLAVIKKAVTHHNFRDLDYLTFEPLTLVPFQHKLILHSMLTEKELKWLNSYHSRCKEVVGKFLKDQGKYDAYNWLSKETSHLG